MSVCYVLYIYLYVLQICEFLLGLQEVAGEGFGINLTDTLQGETGTEKYITHVTLYRTHKICYPRA